MVLASFIKKENILKIKNTKTQTDKKEKHTDTTLNKIETESKKKKHTDTNKIREKQKQTIPQRGTYIQRQKQTDREIDR